MSYCTPCIDNTSWDDFLSNKAASAASSEGQCLKCLHNSDTKSCGNCGKRYCSKECQLKDWGKHKPDCDRRKKYYDSIHRFESGDLAEVIGIRMKGAIGRIVNTKVACPNGEDGMGRFHIVVQIVIEGESYNFEASDLRFVPGKFLESNEVHFEFSLNKKTSAPPADEIIVDEWDNIITNVVEYKRAYNELSDSGLCGEKLGAALSNHEKGFCHACL